MSGSVSCGGGGCSIVWFRRDLRVEDNLALVAAVRDGSVVAVFVWAPEEERHYHPGRVSRWWLKNSCLSLIFLLEALVLFSSLRDLLIVLLLFLRLLNPLVLLRSSSTIFMVAWANEGNEAGEERVNLFHKSIGLREYSRYISFNHPYSHERPLLGHLKFFPWAVDENNFKAWRQGQTGYLLVDDGMRELWATGWLHNRIRVVVSSFFVKVLQLPWRWGMKYFWDTFLDADLK